MSGMLVPGNGVFGEIPLGDIADSRIEVRQPAVWRQAVIAAVKPALAGQGFTKERSLARALLFDEMRLARISHAAVPREV
ncbi:hypothetical protein [Mesorhizobium sp. KR9-304]|uniref:hypothetical protein n=1 Tax=Mesorhizobium sp. KR9-304 TaxID=3156614 RepID=UPI0032B4CFF1